jgi:hypothetical protein
MPTPLKGRLISEAITREINARSPAWEIDPSLKKVRFEIVIGRSTGMPTSIHCETLSESDLTDPRKYPR